MAGGDMTQLGRGGWAAMDSRAERKNDFCFLQVGLFFYVWAMDLQNSASTPKALNP